MVRANQELDEAMREEYQSHALEELERIEQILLDIDSEKISPDATRKIQLIIHSIKGSSGTYGFSFASNACHSLEDYLNSEDLSQNKSNIMDNILNYIDLLKDYFNHDESSDDEKVNSYRQRLESLSSIKSSVDYRVLIVELSKTLSLRLPKNGRQSYSNGLLPKSRRISREKEIIIKTYLQCRV